MRKLIACLSFVAIVLGIAIVGEPATSLVIVLVFSVMLFVGVAPGHFQTNQLVYGISKYRFPVWLVTAIALCLMALAIGFALSGKTPEGWAFGVGAFCSLAFRLLKQKIVRLRPIRFWIDTSKGL